MTRVVVTGGSGFLGRHVCRILASSFEVVPVSRRAVADIETTVVGNYMNAPDGDVLIHLAELNHRGRAEAAGESYRQLALSTLERLVAKPFSHVIYASSGAVYNDTALGPRRTQDPVTATDVYTRTKIDAEQIVVGARGTVLRLGNLFGPRMSPDTVVAVILDQVPGSGPLRVRDDRPVRDYLWVEDAAVGFFKVMTHPAGGVFNLGTGVGTSVRGLAESALRAVGESGRSVEATHPSGRRSTVVLDISKTRSDLDWQPSVTVDEGLRRLIATRTYT